MSRTALFAAAKAWDAPSARRILAAKPALATATDASGRAALHVCAKRSYVEYRAESAQGMATVRALLDAGTPFDLVHPIPEERTTFPATPLWYAVAHGRNPVMTRFFLDLGATPDHCLFAAVWTDDVDILAMLIAAGAPLEPNAFGATPLVYAAQLGREASIRVLVAAGAAIGVVDHRGRSPYQLARARKVSAATLALLQGDGSAATPA